MGSKGGGGGSSNMGFSAGSSTYSPNPQAMASYNKALSMAENVASIPYQPYKGQMTAGFTPDQMASFQATRNMQGMMQPYTNAGLNMLNQAVDYSDPRLFNQRTLAQYQNPYQQQVVDATMANMRQLQAEGEQQNRTRAATQGTFGGSGEFRGRAEIARQQALANAQTLAGLQQQGYSQAVNQYNQQQQQAISTAQNAAYGLGQLGNQAQQAALQSIQALLGTGGMQQQLAQSQLTGAYNQFLQERAYPYQQAAFYSGIASGIAPNMGGTTNTVGFNMGQTQQQQASGGGAGVGMLSSVLSFLPMLMGSDRDDKTDIKYLGKDPETGEKLYSYRYKDDPKSYPKVVGPMAQDIEKHSPERVHEIGGHKVVEGFGRLASSHPGHIPLAHRNHAADGGSQSSDPMAAIMGGTGGGQGAYAAPSAPSLPSYSSSQAGGQSFGALGAPAQGATLDPGLSQFLQGAFDPQTADKVARSKWVNQPQSPTENQTTGDNYVIPPGLMNDGGSAYPYHPMDGEPKAFGGRAERAVGGGSFFDLIKKGGTQGPYSEAPDNYMAAAQEVGIGKIIPQARDIAKEITKSGAESAMRDAAQAAKGQGGGGGGSGGSGGAPKLPSMKGSKKSAVPSKESATSPDQLPGSESTASSQSPGLLGSQGSTSADQSQAPDVGPGAKEAAQGDFNFAANAAPLPEASPVVQQFNVSDMAPPPVEPPQIMPAVEPQIPLLGMFGGFAEGGRVHRDGGGGLGGFGKGGEGLGAGSTPADAGFGDIVLGKATSPGDAAGIGNLIKGQETLTGENLMNKLTKQYWERDPGEQRSPVEQGMPAMPDEKYYTTPREDLPGKLMSQHYGEENQSEIPGMMAMMGGGMGGLGLAMMINQQQRASDARGAQQQLLAKRDAMLADPKNFPVEGYFTELSSTPSNHPEMGMQLNPRTGLYNLKYTGAYRGMPYKDGGSVHKEGGGALSYVPSAKDLDYWARTVLREAGNQGRAGMEAVAHVIKNRLESGKFGKTIADVVTAPKQFSPWNRENIGKPADPRRVNPQSEGYKKALDVVKSVASGEVKSPVGSSTHFANPDAVKAAYNGRIPQKWLRNMMADPSTVRIGQHIFNTTGAGAKDQGQKYAINAPAQRAVPYQPEARPLAFKPKEGLQPIVAEDKSGVSVNKNAPPTGSALNYINPKDPSGPLLEGPRQKYAESMRPPDAEISPTSSVSSGAPLKGEGDSAFRKAYFDSINPPSANQSPRTMSDSEITSAVGRGEHIFYDKSGNAIRSAPESSAAPAPSPADAQWENRPRYDYSKPSNERVPLTTAPHAGVPAAAPPPMPFAPAPETPHKRLSLGDFNPIGSAHAGDRGVYPTSPAPETQAPGFAYNPRYDYAPGVSEIAKNPMTEFGKTARQGQTADELSESFFKDMPMSQSPFAPFGAMPNEAPSEIVSQDKRPEIKEAAKPQSPQKMYWGDYRDVENNPFGDFIDEFAGDVRKSPTAGTATTPMGKFAGEGGLGQIFDLEGTLPPEISHPSADVNAPDQSQGFDFGSLFDIFG